MTISCKLEPDVIGHSWTKILTLTIPKYSFSFKFSRFSFFTVSENFEQKMPPNQLVNLIILLICTWNKTVVYHYLYLYFWPHWCFDRWKQRQLDKSLQFLYSFKGKNASWLSDFVWNFTLATSFLFFYIDWLWGTSRYNCLQNRVEDTDNPTC